MKTKFNKAFLALAAAAIMAAAVFAGVAITSADADADIIEGIVIDGDSTKDYNVYVVNTKTSTKAVVTETGKYTGRMSFGTYYGPSSGKTFVPHVTADLTNVTNLVIKYSAASDTVTLSGNMGGTAVFTKGTAVLGGDATDYFSGMVNGNTVDVKAANIYGLKITAGTTDTIGGEANKGNQPLLSGTVDATVTMDGTAYVTGLQIGPRISVSVSAETVLTGDFATCKPFYLGNNDYIYFGAGAVAAHAANRATGWISNSNGELVAYTATPAISDLGKMSFTVSSEMHGDTVYRFFASLDENGAGSLYAGSMSFGTERTGNNLTVTPILPQSAEISAFDGTLTVSGADKTIGYGSAHRCVFASAISADGSISRSMDTSTLGEIRSSVAFVDGDRISIIFINSNTGRYQGCVGTYSAGEHKVNLAPSFGTILSGAGNTAGTLHPDAIGAVSSLPYIEVDALSSLAVAGNVNLGYTYGVSNNSLSNFGTVDVSGMLSYETNSLHAPLTTTDTEVINAVCYTLTGTASNPGSVYKYTNLDAAISAAKSYSVYGRVCVAKNTLLTGHPEGTSENKNNITVERYSILEIGKNSSEESAEAVVTIPATSELIIVNEANNGKVHVNNGMLKIAGETTSRSIELIRASVFVNDGSYGIYTDLMAALDMSKAGDIISIRAGSGDAEVTRACEVKSGVTLDTTNVGMITLRAGSVLTVSGSMRTVPNMVVEGASETKAAATLLIKSEDVKITLMNLAGEIAFDAAFDNTASAVSPFLISSVLISGTAAKPSVVTVDGKVKMFSFSRPEVGEQSAEVVVTGTALFGTGFASTVPMSLRASGTATVTGETDLTFYDAYVLGDAAVEMGEGKILKVSHRGVFGTVPVRVEQSTNPVVARNVVLEESAMAKVYGIAAGVTFTDSVKASTAFKFVEDDEPILFQTVYAGTAFAPPATGTQMTLPTDPIVGHTLVAWYSDQTFTTAVTSALCGEHTSLFAKLTKASYRVDFKAAQGVVWYLNGVSVSGDHMMADYGKCKVTVGSAPGFIADKVTATMGGLPYVLGTQFILSGPVTFEATDATPVDNTGLYIVIGIIALTGILAFLFVLNKMGRLNF